MPMIDVVGPLHSEDDARATAQALGSATHGVYSRAVKDADGYDTDARVWFVERDTDAVPDTIFGYSWVSIQAKQQRR